MPRPTPRQVRRIAYEAHVCEKTVVRYFDGGRVRPSSRERIEETLRRSADEEADA